MEDKLASFDEMKERLSQFEEMEQRMASMFQQMQQLSSQCNQVYEQKLSQCFSPCKHFIVVVSVYKCLHLTCSHFLPWQYFLVILFHLCTLIE